MKRSLYLGARITSAEGKLVAVVGLINRNGYKRVSVQKNQENQSVRIIARMFVIFVSS